MTTTSAIETKGARLTHELREFLKRYLVLEGAPSLRSVARRVGISHVSLQQFRDGGGIGMENGIQLAEAIGFDLSKFLSHAH